MTKITRYKFEEVENLKVKSELLHVNVNRTYQPSCTYRTETLLILFGVFPILFIDIFLFEETKLTHQN